ncbi:hypothetical protein GWK47_012546 [Chionoecetes opilio]|uniref:Uncharacterized protein n=1 Tax=Chionoecetes opilio TaxID=41210 RepID=A0A8J4XW20_CHIOP|nr:hypothetical protein GWK47_012546 [Chionoecetes opilio]
MQPADHGLTPSFEELRTDITNTSCLSTLQLCYSLSDFVKRGTVYQDVSSITQGCLQQEGNEIEEPEPAGKGESAGKDGCRIAGASMCAICAEFDIKSSTFYPFTGDVVKEIEDAVILFCLSPNSECDLSITQVTSVQL